MRRLLYAALIFALLGPMPGTVMRFPEADLTQSVAARPIAFAPSASGMLRFVRGWHLVSPHRRFGGFSPLARTRTEAGADPFQLIGATGYATPLPHPSPAPGFPLRVSAPP